MAKKKISEKQLAANRKNAQKAGRPIATSTLQSQLFREQLAKRVTEKAEKFMDAIEDSALGHFVEVEGKDGKVKVYKKSPDSQAWSRLMDRAFGKPKQIVGEDKENPFQGVIVLPALNNDDED